MKRHHENLTRRQFLRRSAGGVGGVVFSVLPGCGGGGGGGRSKASLETPKTVFRLSGRGRRISRAAKAHNANHLFLTIELADNNRAHPGDRSRIVPVKLSAAEFNRLFKKRKFVDLRKI